MRLAAAARASPRRLRPTPTPPPRHRRTLTTTTTTAMASSSSGWTCEYVPDAASGGTSSAPYLAALERFSASAAASAAGGAPRFVIFTSDLVDGRYWCPDCVTTVPAVKKAAQKAGVPLLEIGVGDRAAWRGNAAHPLRALCGLSGVPTLVRLTAEGNEVAARLGPELEAAGTPEEAERLAGEFFAASRG
jgi:thiol-disulfide isomerase/thioredoxin